MTDKDKIAIFRLHSSCIDKIIEIINILAQMAILINKEV